MTRRSDAIRVTLGERFVPVALRGLPRMVVDDGKWFSFKSLAGDGPGELINEGTSERYTAMSLIGLLRQRELGREAETPIDHGPLLDSLDAWARKPIDLGDVGLVLWVHLLAGDARAESLTAHLLSRRAELFDVGYGTSMMIGCLIAGLALAIDKGVGGDAVREFAKEAKQRLLDNRSAQSGLFSFGRRVFRKNLHRARVDGRLGSFASQVYPTIGLSMLAQATGDEQALDAARQCADRIVDLQGPSGQWWWVYHPGRSVPVVRFPVYTVHQDAMGPMMLCAAALADGAHQRYDDAIFRSLEWFDDRPELPAAGLIDGERGAVWRAVQHDDPVLTGGRLGLGPGEIGRMGRAAWLGNEDRRPLAGGFVCPECRSYHLGWILLADAMYRELLAKRG